MLGKPLRRTILCGLLAALGLAAGSPAAIAQTGELRIGGTGNALGTLRLLGDAFARLHPGVKPVVLASIGSSGAIRAVPRRAIDIGLSARPLTEEEDKSGLQAVEFARTPTVFAVRETSPVNGITIEQVADIYTGKLTHWPDGTAVRPVMRQAGDDNTRQIRQLSALIDQALTVADQRQGLTFASSDQEAAEKIESIPGSIGVTSLALIRAEKRPLKALTLDGIEPTPANAVSGRYPMIKRLYFILPREPSPLVRNFMDFMQTPEARKILEQTGHSLP